MKKILLLCTLFFVFLLTGCKKSTRKINEKTESDKLEITLYAHNGKSESKFLIKSFGHSFIALKNTSGSTINLYGYDLTDGDEITFGAWGIDDNYGIWFDLESQYYHNAKRYKGVASVTAYVSLDKLDIINEFIGKHDDWTLTENCTYIAQNIWDLCVDENERIGHVALNNPKNLRKEILRFESSMIDRPMVKHDYAFTLIDGELKYYQLEEKSYA